MVPHRRFSCLGVLAFVIACGGSSDSDKPVEAEPVEPATAEQPESARSHPEQLLGLSLEDPVVQEFIGDSKVEKKQFDFKRYAIVRERGFDLVIEGGRITTVFLYGSGNENHREYADPVPGGIQFTDDAEQVRSRLGAPSKSAYLTAWDKWYRETWSLFVEYGDDGRVELVSLMTLHSDPDR